MSLVAYAKSVIPGGQTIGIELRTKGLIVSGTYDVKIPEGTYNPANEADIQKGDIILFADQVPMHSINDLILVLKGKPSTAGEIALSLERKGATIQRKLRIIRTDAGTSWRTGLFIKERLLGIGTLTFYDPETQTYGALGHEIIDQETGQPFEVKSGTIFESTVIEVKKSENGSPGEKIADIDEDKTLGNVAINNRFGIYGSYDDGIRSLVGTNTIEIGTQDQVHTGPAQIWTVIDGKEVEKYAIEIILVRPQKEPDTKSLTFRVTDPVLLSKTAGIIQGMSGSPIIQDGRLIGAVTHVLVDRVTMGHGLYIEWMLVEARKISEE